MHYDESADKAWWYPRHPGVVICDILGLLTSLYWLIESAHWTTDIYLMTLVILYLVSGLCHHMRAHHTWLRRLDHVMIFYIIAITALPYWGHILPFSWYAGGPLLIVTICLIGTIVKTNSFLPRYISGALYVVASVPMVGYFIINYELIEAPFGALWLIGIVLYALQLGVYTFKKPNPFNEYFGYREIQHMILLVATNLHAMIAVTLATP